MEGQPNLMENAVVLQLRFHKPAAHRKGDLSKVETPADKTRLSLGKKIWDCLEYVKLQSVAGEFTRWLKTRELASPFSSGMHLIPVGTLPEVYDRLDAAEAAFAEAAEAFVSVVPRIIGADRLALDDQFCEADYPDERRLRAACWVERRLVDFAPPGASKVGSVLSEREGERWRKQLQDAAADVTAALREAAREVFARLADRLGSADGKRTQLKAAPYEAAREFLDLFGQRNICGDEELAAVVEAARKVLNGKSVEGLRSEKEYFRDKASSIVADLDKLVAAAPRRKIVFKEDET